MYNLFLSLHLIDNDFLYLHFPTFRESFNLQRNERIYSGSIRVDLLWIELTILKQFEFKFEEDETLPHDDGFNQRRTRLIHCPSEYTVITKAKLFLHYH